MSLDSFMKKPKKGAAQDAKPPVIDEEPPARPAKSVPLSALSIALVQMPEQTGVVIVLLLLL